jgi:hypothetical protein
MIAWFLIAFYFHGISVTPVPTQVACETLLKHLQEEGVKSVECVGVNE